MAGMVLGEERIVVPEGTRLSVMVALTLNGKLHRAEVEERTLLSDFIRDVASLTGTHRGCDTAQCGACVVLLDGHAVKSCNVLAVQVTGAHVTTIEGLADASGALHPMQSAFKECHGLQCGFCTPGMIMSAIDLLKRHPSPDEKVIRRELDGNICRCTGYENIVKAIQRAAQSGNARL
jgi:carbon-monoxide dehydrogenase small subunit